MKDGGLNDWIRAQNLGLQGMCEREAIRQAAIDREAREAQRAEDERRAADARVLAKAPSTPQERRTFGEALARTHRVTVRESRTIPAGTWGYASWSQRRITIPPDWADSEEGFACFLHEVGHILAGECSKQEPHRRDATVTDWHHCLECERLADVWAWRLVPVFTRSMFNRLRGGSRQYRRKTPASRAVLTAVDRLNSDSTFAQHIQARAEHERRLEQFAEIEQWAAEARRPRPLTRREQQIAEIRAIARECEVKR